MAESSVQLIGGDCRLVLGSIEDGSIDALVTDPPAAIGFMGKEWDSFGGKTDKTAKRDREKASLLNNGRQQTVSPFTYDATKLPKEGKKLFITFLSSVMSEVIRTLKPGAFGLVWAFPRTSHWTATALEDAGFEIKDVVYHIFGSGFPKGKSCLKPAVENWILVRKPGKMQPLQIDECRIACDGANPAIARRESAARNNNVPVHGGKGMAAKHYAEGKIRDRRTPEAYLRGATGGDHLGRWPANLVLSHHDECECAGTKRVKTGSNGGGAAGVSRNGTMGDFAGTANQFDYADANGLETVEDWRCHPDCPVRLLDEQSGTSKSNGGKTGGHLGGNGIYGAFADMERGNAGGIGDTGGASRFFYCAKASRRDRGDGNDHPTVKNTELMRWLVKLITKPNDLVLDPFAGSASTALACIFLDRRFLGVEANEKYLEIAQKRIDDAISERKGCLFGYS